MPMASATSPTKTGWKRVPAPASGRTGRARARLAKRLKKLSPGPKTTEGRKITASGRASSTTASPAAFERA